ncbi:hypothetical protein CDAR_198001 [Caerostris darwini]|uniref:Uncharacterized protein n=1 Tax=Caerostris darwini TaxID=1538125 RepID=A0AAV4RCM6_9ARAC|nr:hypothetical protein CDAR_198001 [Caerostris darwini]
MHFHKPVFYLDEAETTDRISHSFTGKSVFITFLTLRRPPPPPPYPKALSRLLPVSETERSRVECIFIGLYFTWMKQKTTDPISHSLREIRLHHLSHITSTPTLPKFTVRPSADVLFLGTCHLKSEFTSRDVKVVCSPYFPLAVLNEKREEWG